MALRTALSLALGSCVLVAAACGGGDDESGVYALEPTRACLQQAGVGIGTRDLDFVASTALNGAIRAVLPDNEVTLSFGESPLDARRIARAYDQFADPGIPLEHVLARDRNVVLLWTAPPADDEEERVRDCLRG